MRGLAVLSYALPVALFWLIWAALTFWLGVPEWFSELVKYACIVASTLAIALIAVIGGWDD